MNAVRLGVLIDNLIRREKKRKNHCFPVNIRLFKVNKRNTVERCRICPKLTIKMPK